MTTDNTTTVDENDDNSLITLDGFKAAIIGVAPVWQLSPEGGAVVVDTVIYDGYKIIEILRQGDSMSLEEAIEYVDYNVIGAYVGRKTPIVVWPDNGLRDEVYCRE